MTKWVSLIKRIMVRLSCTFREVADDVSPDSQAAVQDPWNSAMQHVHCTAGRQDRTPPDPSLSAAAARHHYNSFINSSTVLQWACLSVCLSVCLSACKSQELHHHTTSLTLWELTQCYLPLSRDDIPVFTHWIKADTWFNDPRGMQGWDDLIVLLTYRGGIPTGKWSSIPVLTGLNRMECRVEHVCMSVCEHISETACPKFTKFSVHVASGRSSHLFCGWHHVFL